MHLVDVAVPAEPARSRKDQRGTPRTRPAGAALTAAAQAQAEAVAVAAAVDGAVRPRSR